MFIESQHPDLTFRLASVPHISLQIHFSDKNLKKFVPGVYKGINVYYNTKIVCCIYITIITLSLCLFLFSLLLFVSNFKH